VWIVSIIQFQKIMPELSPMQYIELFHLLFLDQLGRKLDKKYYALKGGCNLRFYLQSIRYSEDMDLDVQGIAAALLRDRVNLIFQSKTYTQILQVRGMRIAHVSEPKQTGTTQRWKLALQTSSPLPLHTKIEFSRRGMPEETRFDPVTSEVVRQYQLRPIMANHYPGEIAFRQKVAALVTRTLTQARDVFDLHLLITSGFAPQGLPDNLKQQAEKAQENAMSVSFAIFKSQVLAYLPSEYQSQYDSASVWEEMVLKVVEALGKGAA